MKFIESKQIQDETNYTPPVAASSAVDDSSGSPDPVPQAEAPLAEEENGVMETDADEDAMTGLGDEGRVP